MSKKIYYSDIDRRNSGAACLSILSQYYGKVYSLETALRNISSFEGPGTISNLESAAEARKFRTQSFLVTKSDLRAYSSKPLIVELKDKRFTVLYEIKKDRIHLSDPAVGKMDCSMEEFYELWLNGSSSGRVLQIEPGIDFDSSPEESDAEKPSTFKFVVGYLVPHKKQIFHLFIGLLIGSVLNMAIPFFTQSIVDTGIENKDIGFVKLILLSQLFLILISTVIGYVRRWIILYMGNRINIFMVSDFLRKLMRLPFPYFERASIGDLFQRIEDHRRVETFLSVSLLNFTFALFNLILFTVLLAFYNTKVMLVFVVGSVMYLLWLFIFMGARRRLDARRFELAARSQNAIIQIIEGMREIKLHNSERNRRWYWERVQGLIFKMNTDNLKVEQRTQSGTLGIIQCTNLLVSYFAAEAVITGEITLGMMIAILYIVGNLSSPVNELLAFVNAFQDAHLSIQRISKIYQERDEEQANRNKITALPETFSLRLKNVSFKYTNEQTEPTLRDINALIPAGKFTAIVGASGSGKSTLLKILLRIYQPTSGDVRIGEIDLSYFNERIWRDRYACVLQGSFIFNDSLANNIALGEDVVDYARLIEACRLACVDQFIETLPEGFQTFIGADGKGLSQGQLQRILIARAIYRNADFLFLDEATNALDSITESQIMRNLEEHFSGKTVIWVAHRLNTIMNADQIMVMDKGEIVECGKHHQLIDLQGYYYKLFKTQLEVNKQ